MYFGIKVKLIWELSVQTGGQRTTVLLHFRWQLLDFLPVLRFFLGCKCVVCADYRCISVPRGLTVCSFCSETSIYLLIFLALYCSWWLRMEVLHPLVSISSGGLTSAFSFMQFSPKEGSDTVIMEDESNASAVSTSEHKCENYEGECQLFHGNRLYEHFCSFSSMARWALYQETAGGGCWEVNKNLLWNIVFKAHHFMAKIERSANVCQAYFMIGVLSSLDTLSQK